MRFCCFSHFGTELPIQVNQVAFLSELGLSPNSPGWFCCDHNFGSVAVRHGRLAHRSCIAWKRSEGTQGWSCWRVFGQISGMECGTSIFWSPQHQLILLAKPNPLAFNVTIHKIRIGSWSSHILFFSFVGAQGHVRLLWNSDLATKPAPDPPSFWWLQQPNCAVAPGASPISKPTKRFGGWDGSLDRGGLAPSDTAWHAASSRCSDLMVQTMSL